MTLIVIQILSIRKKINHFVNYNTVDFEYHFIHKKGELLLKKKFIFLPFPKY